MSSVAFSIPAPQPSGALQPRIIKAAHEFEAQMMKELLKPLTSGSTLTGDEDDAGSGTALKDFASEALGLALSERGGLGIANSVFANLSHSDS